MNKSIGILALGLSLSVALPVSAEEVAGEATMDVIDSRDFKPRMKHRAAAGARAIIHDYMLENGDITEEELEARKAEREATREELRALREAGDTDAFEARLAELREVRQERREATREYIEANSKLADALAEYRDEVRERRQERREAIRDRIRERREERLEEQADS